MQIQGQVRKQYNRTRNFRKANFILLLPFLQASIIWCLKSEMRTHSSYSPTCVVLLLKPRHQKIGKKEFQGFFISLTGTTDNIISS